ncbi:MAG: hypothetical protein ACYC6W_11715 [Nitrosotalea sp.]
MKVRRSVATQVGQKCPVCNGFGTLTSAKMRCHACEGRGYILVPAEEKEVYGSGK